MRLPTHSLYLSKIESEGKVKINLSENENVKFWAEMTQNLTQPEGTRSKLGEGGSPGAVQYVSLN